MMLLKIDGNAVAAEAGQSVRDLILALGMDSLALRERPLAAKIAGEVFTLTYVPVRATPGEEDSIDVRRAMAASGGEIQLLHYTDSIGKKVYTRTECFLVFLAIRTLWPKAAAKISCTLGNAVYVSIEGETHFSVAALKDKVREYIAEDFPFVRRRMTRQEAIRQFEESNRPDKAELLRWYQSDYFDEYVHEGFSDYFFGEMLPSSGYLTVWNLLETEGGVIIQYPDDLSPDRPAEFKASPNFFSVFSEGERWGTLMECSTVADLNRKTRSGSIRELIRVNEALHEKRISQIADMVCQREARVVMLAGPSSSGKTTSANRLATQLRVHGKKPILMSLDNYYIDRDKLAPGPDGKLDLEHINTLDTPLFRADIAALLAGQEVMLPTFNFVAGKREWDGKKLRLEDNSVIIVEGIHGLNSQMVPDGVAEHEMFKLYVSPLLPLNLDNHNRIPTSYLRLLRRIVRDYETRGSSVQRTISMWDSVQSGEKRWIFPYQENADVIFNSSTLYELAVLKKHIFPLLTQITPEDSCYDQVRSIVGILDFVQEADVDDEIPPTSIIREFIGGNTYYR